MVLFIGLYSFYFLLMVVAVEFVDFKQRNAFFWGLITFVFTPIVTIIFILCLGESERAKDKKVSDALREIALLEFQASCDFEEVHYLSRFLWKERHVIKAAREARAKKKLAETIKNEQSRNRITDYFRGISKRDIKKFTRYSSNGMAEIS